MTSHTRRLLVAGAALLGASTAAMAAGPFIPNVAPYPNATGTARTYSLRGDLDMSNAFFQSLGTNGRSCASCHAPAEGFSVTPAVVRQRFDETGGTDPLFRPVDGANAPYLDVSTVEARRRAYSMLLTKGLIRVGLAIPAGADFRLEAVDDPYAFASASQLSLFRRPLPATNLRFLTTVMWDGRETFAGQTTHFNLKSQATHATMGHAERSEPLTDAQQEEIVGFEESLFTAQAFDQAAFSLSAQGGLGGPINLSRQAFRFGINSPLSSTFDRRAFTLYDGWASSTSAAKLSVLRGQTLFNERTFRFSNGQTVTCSRCHNAPNTGSDSIGGIFNIGTALPTFRTPDMPLYTLRCNSGVLARTTDPGRAMITGRCVDIGKFKIPTLRGLAARPPYFHNGMAARLHDVVNFYDLRFGLGLTASERADLVMFLRAL